MNLSMQRQDDHLITLEKSELIISSAENVNLIAYSLRSCVGISVYDPISKIGALLRCCFPCSSQNPLRAKEQPSFFVDTGLPFLLSEMFKLGSLKKHLICRVAGCSSFSEDREFSKLGLLNYKALKKILLQYDIPLSGEIIGGKNPKTMVLQMNRGKTFIQIHHDFIEI